MDRASMLAELRDVINDASVDGVWGESTLLGYLAEGQDKFCEQTGYFRDATTHTITLVADTAVYAIPDRAIEVLQIWNGNTRLGKYNPEDIDTVDDSWELDPEQSGPPIYWRTDRTTGYIELSPTPTSEEAGTSLALHVWRYSATALDAASGEPEIPSRFHRACIEWAAFKAFSHHDMEAQDPVKATDHRRAFDSYVVDGITALDRIQNRSVRVGFSPAYRT